VRPHGSRTWCQGFAAHSLSLRGAHTHVIRSRFIRCCLQRAALLFVAVVLPLHAQTTTITFDDLPPAADALVPNNFQGLQWSLGYVTVGTTAYADVLCRSGNTCAYQGLPNVSIASTTPMTLSAWVRRWAPFGGASAANTLLIEALDNVGGVLGSQTLALNSAYQQFTISTLFSSLRMTPTGTSSAGYYQVDDVVVTRPTTVVPEPSTYAMMATGLIGLVGVRRSRSRQVAATPIRERRIAE
jgi:hypothetical protein